MTRGPIVKAMAIVRRPADGALLVSEARDPATGSVFQRPLGGTLEFGEHGHETIQREFREELARDVGDIEFVRVVWRPATADQPPAGFRRPRAYL